MLNLKDLSITQQNIYRKANAQAKLPMQSMRTTEV